MNPLVPNGSRRYRKNAGPEIDKISLQDLYPQPRWARKRDSDQGRWGVDDLGSVNKAHREKLSLQVLYPRPGRDRPIAARTTEDGI
jgi:hypothetical protein